MAYSVSSAFRPALADSHVVATRVRARSATGVFTTLTTVGGSISVDIDRAVRRDCSTLEIVSENGSLIPTSTTSLLSPISGAELWIDRGIQYNNGSTEYVPLGRFGWTTVTVDYQADGAHIYLDGIQDRSQRIIQATYNKMYSVSSAVAVETVISTILKRAWPSMPGVNLLPTTGRTIAERSFGIEGDSDPWTDCVQIAEEFGYRLFFDVTGQVKMTRIGTSLSGSLVTYSSDYPLVTNIQRSWNDENTYSGVIATGSGTRMFQPYRAVAYDDNVTSPTYYLGPFGKRIRVYTSTTIGSTAQAALIAKTQLQKTLGVAETVTWEQIPDPSLDVGDVVTLKYPNISLNRAYRIDRLEIPLDVSSLMTVTARERRVS